MENYLDSYKSAVGASNMGEHGVTSVTNDSWEAGSQNWTDDMVEQFRRLRGYNPMPWMPVLTGVVVGSSAQSDRFLWDFRETIGDLISSQHFGTIQQVLDQWHLQHYCESDEGGRAFVADGMEVKKDCQIPMGAMWTQSPGVNKIEYNYNTDDRESASVAHIYGQNLAAAESMTASTAPWAWSPATLRPTADQEFLNGINRIFIHESAHQPLINAKPGLTLGKYGQWFNRNETWANQAKPWVSYLARNSYMLQQGRFAADILYFYGQDTNLTALYRYRVAESAGRLRLRLCRRRRSHSCPRSESRGRNYHSRQSDVSHPRTQSKQSIHVAGCAQGDPYPGRRRRYDSRSQAYRRSKPCRQSDRIPCTLRRALR